MNKSLLAALAAATLCINAGCCRSWFIWPGHNHYSPSFSPCCERVKLWPFNRDPFEKEDLRNRLRGLGRKGHAHRVAWGRGNTGGRGCFGHGLFGHCHGWGCHGCNCHGWDRPGCGCGCGWDCHGHGCHGCQTGHGVFSSGPHGYAGHGHAGHGHAGHGHAGHGYAGHAGMGYPGMGYPGGVSPEGIPLQAAPGGMSAAQVAYPYYTNRAPRDFLLGYPPGRQPPSIGP